MQRIKHHKSQTFLQRFLPSARRKTGGTAELRRRRLRGLVGTALGRPEGKPLSPERITLGICTALVLSALLCIHLLPNRVSLRLGDVSDRDIIAPRTVRYEDTQATRRLRAEAARLVDKRYLIIPGATSASLDAVDAAFDLIEAAAAVPTPAVNTSNTATPKQPIKPGSPVVAKSPAVKAAQKAAATARHLDVAADVRQRAGISVPASAVGTLVQTTAPTRATARDIAIRLVGRAMERAITEDTSELADAKEDASRSTLLNRLSNPEVRRATAALTGAALAPNRRVDEKETEKQRQAAEVSVSPQIRRLSAGEPIIEKGERVTQQHLDTFAALGLQNARPDGAAVSVIILLVCLLIGLTTAYLRQFHAELYNDTARLFLLSLLTVFSVLGLKAGSALLGVSVPGVPFVYLGMMCVASAGMVIALLLSPRVATLIVALLSVASGLILNNELRYTLITLGSSLAGIVSVASLKNRSDLLRATLLVCGTNAILSVLAGQIEGDLSRELLLGAMWGIVSGVFAVAVFYFGVATFEKPFGITTHLRLLELSDPATPVLQEFRLRAPGTYAHSLMVSNLAHAAAEAVGADALLVRVAAYYHDLGKMNRPEFFIENQSSAENIHDRLSPSMSAIILASHVKEGVEMAEEIGLPPRVREVIAQHHGTTLMKYFYHRATGGSDDPRLEAQFRYAGPKPQTREAAILMLADSVEAASRTLTRPTPQRVADFVRAIVEDKRADGQLEECELTLRDVATVQDSFVRTLSGALHARVEYPGQNKPAPRSASVAPAPFPLPQPLAEGGLSALALSLVPPPTGFPESSNLEALNSENDDNTHRELAESGSTLPSTTSNEHGNSVADIAGTSGADDYTRPRSRQKTARPRR